MKRILFFILVLTGTIAVAQKNKEAIDLYDQGIIAFNKKDYKTADSLFTKSAALEPHVDTYYNLASVKYKLGDNCEFCKYIEIASKYGDKEASKLFNTKCFKNDTTFYKNINDNSSYSVITTGICDKIQNQHYDVKTGDSVKYSFCFMDSAYQSVIRNFDKFPDIDSNLQSIVFYLTDEMPTLLSEGKNIFKFLSENIIYPKEARKDGMQGTVYISFIVDESGKINKVSIKKSACEPLDNEALRVVNLMKQWTPGKYKNKAVKVSFVLPVRFLLQ